MTETPKPRTSTRPPTRPTGAPQPRPSSGMPPMSRAPGSPDLPKPAAPRAVPPQPKRQATFGAAVAPRRRVEPVMPPQPMEGADSSPALEPVPLTMDALRQRVSGAMVNLRPDSRSPQPDRTLTGATRLVFKEELARTPTERISVAQDLTLRRRLLVRHLIDASELAQSRFLEEAQITAQLQHPNIIPVYDLGLGPDGKPWMVTSRVYGQPLDDFLAEFDSQIEPTELALAERERKLLEIFLKICDGVSFAHARGVIHRDLRPEIIRVGNHGDVLITEWREAKPIASGSGGADPDQVMSDRRELGTPLTLAGTVVGTVPWMPPEQAAGRVAQLNETADIYNLGAILYYLLTGTPPFLAEADDEAVADILEGRLDLPTQRAPYMRIRPELEAIVLKAMAQRPALRYRSVDDLRSALERYLAGLALLNSRTTIGELLRRWVGANPITTALVLLIVLAFIAIPTLLWLTTHATDQATIDRLRDQLRTIQESPKG